MAPPQGTGTGFYAERMDKEILENIAAGETKVFRWLNFSEQKFFRKFSKYFR